MPKSDLKVRKHPATTHRMLTIHWSRMGNVAERRSKWGGLINAWGHEHFGDVYRIPNSVAIYKIDAALQEALLPSDSAVLVYVYGKNKRGSSALRMVTYNIG